jgi:hypothetical protein
VLFPSSNNDKVTVCRVAGMTLWNGLRSGMYAVGLPVDAGALSVHRPGYAENGIEGFEMSQ